MLSIGEEYVRKGGGDRIIGAMIFCEDLMRGDPATFKVGYTAPNAVLAAKDAMDLEEVEVEHLRNALGVAL